MSSEISSFADIGQAYPQCARLTVQKIEAKLKASVTRLARRERKNITKIQLDCVTVDNTLGSLSALSDSLWFGNALDQHKAGNCLDVHKVYIIGHQILAADRTVLITFANVFDLLNLFRSVASGYDTQLCCDGVSGGCSGVKGNKGRRATSPTDEEDAPPARRSATQPEVSGTGQINRGILGRGVARM